MITQPLPLPQARAQPRPGTRPRPRRPRNLICLYHSHVTTQPFADGGPARRGPTARARTGTWPITVQGPQHTWTAGRPRYTRAFKGLGAGLAKHSPELNPLLHTTGRRAGQIHPGTHAASAPARPLTVPAYHEAHTGRRAGGISQGIQVATDPAQPCPAHISPMGRRAGERGLRAIPARPRHIPAAPAHSLRAARPGQTGRGGRPDL